MFRSPFASLIALTPFVMVATAVSPPFFVVVVVTTAMLLASGPTHYEAMEVRFTTIIQADVCRLTLVVPSSTVRNLVCPSIFAGLYIHVNMMICRRVGIPRWTTYVGSAVGGLIPICPASVGTTAAIFTLR
jgi:hypothetical protein